MPFVSEQQRKAMGAALHGHSNLGIPKEVAEKYFAHDMAPILAPNAAVPANVRRLARDAVEGFDMSEEDWRGLIDGLVKFFGEERREPEHAADRKLTHAEVRYGPSTGADRCAGCAHFLKEGPHCQVVEDPIVPEGWCERFEAAGARDDARGKLNEREESEADKGHKQREEQPGDVFLQPEQRKYPVKTRQDGEWKYSRDLLLAAAREARMHGHGDLARRADEIRGREFGQAHDADVEHTATIKYNGDFKLGELLKHIRDTAAIGHSFSVVVDPGDSDHEKSFGVDGDGADRIISIEVDGLAQDEAMMAMDRSFNPGPDSRFEIAMDRDSVREKTPEGRLIVKRTPITKANVCPYRGKEIPGYKDLGLDPDRIYYLLRDPEELRKAAPTSNGVQLLAKHRPVSASDHAPSITVGSLGSDADFDDEYLYNSLYVNAQHAIDGIETGKQRELSAGYRYKPDMTPGNFRGTAYDGVMRDISFNHVALVEDGRAGPDVVVQDEALKESDMKATRLGVRTLHMTAAAIGPLLAMDSAITLKPDLVAAFKGLTTKNFKASRDKLLSGVRLAMDGKLRKGIALDSSIEKFGKALDAFIDDVNSGMDEPAPEGQEAEAEKAAAIQPAKGIADPGSTYDAEPLKSFLREKGMGEDDVAKVMDMMPKHGLAGDESEEEEERKKKDKEGAMDKHAMDEQIKGLTADFDKRIKQVRADERAVRVALSEVKPYIGELPATMAFDTAADVYRHVLVSKGVEGAKAMHADALLPVLKTLPKIGAKPAAEVKQPMAMDQSAVAAARKIAPGLEHISS